MSGLPYAFAGITAKADEYVLGSIPRIISGIGAFVRYSYCASTYLYESTDLFHGEIVPQYCSEFLLAFVMVPC